MSVYGLYNFQDRVNYAVSCIIRGTDSRRRDTCFGMGDGDQVAVAVYRRLLKRPELAEKISTLSKDTLKRCLEEYGHLTNEELKQSAWRTVTIDAIRTCRKYPEVKADYLKRLSKHPLLSYFGSVEALMAAHEAMEKEL